MDLFKTFNEIEKRNVKNLLLEIQSILKYNIGENNYFTIEALISILKQKNIEFTKKDLHMAIHILLIDFGSIVRYDSWNLEPKFQVLDERHKDTSWQKSFYELVDDNNTEDKKFLLIADTHIGNDKMHNFKLINNVYDLAIKNGIRNTFHLGDVFDGVNCNDSKKVKQAKIEEQLKLFMDYYPNLEPSEMRTIALLGNHDKTIYGTYDTDTFVDFDNIKPQLYDLRSITKDNPGFMFYARKMFELELNDIPMHFSHRLYVNSLYRTVKIQKLEDIIRATSDIPGDFPLYFSAHLHECLLCVSKDVVGNNQLFVGVPSTSSLNMDNVVAYIVNINKDEYFKYVHVTALYSTTNDKVYLGETYTHKISEKNKVLKKEFNN